MRRISELMVLAVSIFTLAGCAAAPSADLIPSGDPEQVGADHISQCRKGWLCMWSDPNFGGRIFALSEGTASPNVGKWFNDKMSSYWNRTRKDAVFYQRTGCQGRSLDAPRLTLTTGGEVGKSFNDKLSSVGIRHEHGFPVWCN